MIKAVTSGSSKRKRRSSDICSDIENQPMQDEKRHKEERSLQPEEEEGIDCDERLPLSELPCLVSGNDNDYIREYRSSSPESIIEISPCKGGSSILSKVTRAEAAVSHSGIKTLSDDCKIVLHWPTILRTFDWGKSKKWQNRYICLGSGSSGFERKNMFKNHPGLLPRMRAVLLEWLIEVCDVFKLHKETYYLAIDYIDRFLYFSRDVPKVKLQLIGISCLLIACKIEEIYPPKVTEFAFVTDGACSEDDILSMEIEVIKALNWKLKCITPNCWLLIYLQLGYTLAKKENCLDYLYPVYPPDLYSNVCQLLDLVTLDVSSMDYKYDILAISALFVVCAEKFPLEVSGYNIHDIRECVCWIEAFWAAISEMKKSEDPNFEPIVSPPKRTVTDLSHFLQQHVVNLELLESAQANVQRLMHPSPSSLNLLTPPSSSKKK